VPFLFELSFDLMDASVFRLQIFKIDRGVLFKVKVFLAKSLTSNESVHLHRERNKSFRWRSFLIEMRTRCRTCSLSEAIVHTSHFEGYVTRSTNGDRVSRA